jgi:putative alpha-1,2-mannosidase
LTILAPGARTKPYVKSVTVNGIPLNEPVLRHEMIRDGAVIRFEMSEVEERWGSETVWEEGGGSVGGEAKDEL